MNTNAADGAAGACERRGPIFLLRAAPPASRLTAMERYLFEQPWWTVTVLALAEFVLLAAWRSRRRRAWLLAAIAPPVLAAAAVLTAYLVKTDREQIAEAMEAIGRSVESGKLDGARAYLDASVRAPLPAGGGLNRQEIVARGEDVLRRHPVSKMSLDDVKTTVNGPNATTEVVTRMTFVGGSPVGGEALQISWRLQWVRRAEGWRLTRIELVKPFWLAAWSV